MSQTLELVFELIKTPKHEKKSSNIIQVFKQAFRRAVLKTSCEQSNNIIHIYHKTNQNEPDHLVVLIYSPVLESTDLDSFIRFISVFRVYLRETYVEYIPIEDQEFSIVRWIDYTEVIDRSQLDYNSTYFKMKSLARLPDNKRSREATIQLVFTNATVDFFGKALTRNGLTEVYYFNSEDACVPDADGFSPVKFTKRGKLIGYAHTPVVINDCLQVEVSLIKGSVLDGTVTDEWVKENLVFGIVADSRKGEDDKNAYMMCCYPKPLFNEEFKEKNSSRQSGRTIRMLEKLHKNVRSDPKHVQVYVSNESEINPIYKILATLDKKYMTSVSKLVTIRIPACLATRRENEQVVWLRLLDLYLTNKNNKNSVIYFDHYVLELCLKELSSIVIVD